MVFLCWYGGVFVVVFLCRCFCSVSVVVFLWWCLVVVFLWWCLYGGVVVFLCWCDGVLVVVFLWCSCGGVFVMLHTSPPFVEGIALR